MGDERRFPLLRDWRRNRDESIQSVPWAMLEPHEDQAQRNHGQSLERLAERGGLGVCEMLFILDNKPLNFALGSMTDTPEKVAELKRRVESFEAASSTTKSSLNDPRDARIDALEAALRGLVDALPRCLVTACSAPATMGDRADSMDGYCEDCFEDGNVPLPWRDQVLAAMTLTTRRCERKLNDEK
jgi:hypothetical protein